MKDGQVFHSAFFTKQVIPAGFSEGSGRDETKYGVLQDAGKSGVCSRIRQQEREKSLQYE